MQSALSSRIIAQAAVLTSPLVLVDRQLLQARYEYYSTFGQVYYPVKANHHTAVIQALSSFGSGFEVDSITHLKALRAAGIEGNRLLFSLPLRARGSIETAIELGVTRIVVDSIEEVVNVPRFNGEIEILIRISLSDLLDLSAPEYYKWGANVADVLSIRQYALDAGCRVIGLSFYLSQELYNNMTFSRVLDRLVTLFPPGMFDYLNIGGGLDSSESAPFRNVLLEACRSMKVNQVILEPGRNLLDPCATIMTSVRNVVKRGNGLWAHLDVGIYSGLLDVVLKKKSISILLLDAEELPMTHRYHISGPTSDSLDYLGQFDFPRELAVGDRLLIPGSGAYTNVLATQFCGFDGLEVVVL